MPGAGLCASRGAVPFPIARRLCILGTHAHRRQTDAPVRIRHRTAHPDDTTTMISLQIPRSRTLAVALLALAACGDSDVEFPGDPTDAPEPGGTAIVAEMGDMSLPNPLVAGADLGGNLAHDIFYRALLRGSWDDGRLVYGTADDSPMALARRYEYLPPDSTALRFHMRSDALWSDGTPITAADVVFTYELVGEPELASIRAGVVQHMDSIVAEDDSTVVIHFAQRHPEMLFNSALAVIPRHVFQGTEPGDLRSHPAIQDPAGGRMVVSGPFMIGSWRKGQQIDLVPNPHFRPRPNLERIVFRIIPEPTTRVTELRTGGVDFVRNIPFDQLPTLRGVPHVRLERERQRNYDYIGYNPAGFEPFGNPEIRRALGLAIDVPRIMESLQMEEFAEHAGGPYGPIFEDLYDPELTPPLRQDLEEARRLLDQNGWRDTDGDGIREKGGTPFRFTLITNAGNQRRIDASQIIQQQWRQIGVDARLRTLELNTFFADLYGREYQAALAGWIVALSPDIRELFSGDSPANVTGYANERVDSLFALAQRQPTPEAAAEYWKRAAAEIVRDQPYTWLYYLDTVDAVNERLRGMRIDTYGPFQNAWEWWIPRDRQRRGAGRQPTDTAGGGATAADTASQETRQ